MRNLRGTRHSLPNRRKLTVIAQDPSVKAAPERDQPKQILTAEVTVPIEDLAPGPRGYRVHVIDFDASTQTLYAAKEYPKEDDPYLDASDKTLLTDPGFHAQNVYAIVEAKEGGVFRSRDGGETWAKTTDLADLRQLLLVRPLDL